MRSRECEAARRSCNYDRANASAYLGDAEIVADKLERDWRVGTLMAGLGMVLVWGPLMVMHAMGVF